MASQSRYSKSPEDLLRMKRRPEPVPAKEPSPESIAGPKGSESPDPGSKEMNQEAVIIAASDESDGPVVPEQPLDERDTKIPRPIVSVNGKDVAKPDAPEEKKPAA